MDRDLKYRELLEQFSQFIFISGVNLATKRLYYQIVDEFYLANFSTVCIHDSKIIKKLHMHPVSIAQSRITLLKLNLLQFQKTTKGVVYSLPNFKS